MISILCGSWDTDGYTATSLIPIGDAIYVAIPPSDHFGIPDYPTPGEIRTVTRLGSR